MTVLAESFQTTHRNPLSELREIVWYREALVELVKRDLRLRYRRSVLGIVWTMLNPLLMMGVMTIVFSSFFHFAIQNFPIYVLSAYVIWAFFSQATAIGCTSLLVSAALVRKVNAPPALFPLAAVNAAGTNLLLSLVPLAIIAFLTGGHLTWALITLPLSLALLLLFTYGLTLILASASVFFLDTVHTYQVLLMAWLYVTPIFYPIDIIPDQYAFVFRMNPLFRLIQIFRDPIYAGTWPDPSDLGVAAAYAIGTAVIGWWFFERSRNSFASYL